MPLIYRKDSSKDFDQNPMAIRFQSVAQRYEGVDVHSESYLELSLTSSRVYMKVDMDHCSDCLPLLVLHSLVVQHTETSSSLLLLL